MNSYYQRAEDLLQCGDQANRIKTIAHLLKDKEDNADLLAKVSEQEKEIERLKYWKESAMKLWGPIIEYAQTHQSELGLKLGESISDKILRLLQDRAKP